MGPEENDGLRAKLKTYVLLPYDDETAWKYAELRSIPGRPVEPGDAWIAASALRQGIPLVTHNRTHFVRRSGLLLAIIARKAHRTGVLGRILAKIGRGAGLDTGGKRSARRAASRRSAAHCEPA